MVSIKTSCLLLIAALTAVAAATASQPPRVHPNVHRTLRAQGTVNLIVTLKESTASVVNSVQEAEFATRGAKISNLIERLEAHAAKSQASLDALLDRNSVLEAATATPLFKKKTNFWISNQVYFEAATFELVEKLSSLESVAEVNEEEIIPLPKPMPTSVNTTSNSEAVGLLANGWGLTRMGVAGVWAKGYTGQGVVVGIIDSGVFVDHTALKSKFRADHGWFDALSKTASPVDVDGHGTHIAGIIAGAGGIGVAPDAKWIACRHTNGAELSQSAAIACGQFMLCPTDPSGANKDCSKAPQIVNNSWGGGQGDIGYQATINAWRAAGIIPIFAIGNNGPACGTANAPGDSAAVISVGATTIGDVLPSFSSKGPSADGLVKPEVAAPGQDIRSAWNSGASSYYTASGTSVAAPFVSGVVALMLSARPGSTYNEVKAALTSTAQRAALNPTGYTCGGTPDDVFPNNQYGSGRVDASAAVDSILQMTVPKAADRCQGLSEALCGEFVCEWNGGSGACSSFS